MAASRTSMKAPLQGLRAIYVSNGSFYSRARTRLSALRALGAEVEFIASAGEWVTADGRLIRTPASILSRLGLKLDLSGASDRLLRFDAFEPQLIWIDRVPNLSAAPLRALRRRFAGAVLLAFSEDDMALAHNQSRRWLEALPQYDAVVTTKIINVERRELEALGARRVIYAHQAYDTEQQFPMRLDDEEMKRYGADVSFVGSYEAERATSILRLCDTGISVRVWGSGWTRAGVRHDRLTVEGREVVNRPADLAYTKVLNASKINLGFLRKLNRDQHTSRSLEIPGAGAFMLAERTPEHSQMFREGKEAEFFSSDEELAAKARRYLANERLRLKVAESGHKRALRDYTNTRQVLTILQQVGLAAG